MRVPSLRNGAHVHRELTLQDILSRTGLLLRSAWIVALFAQLAIAGSARAVASADSAAVRLTRRDAVFALAATTAVAWAARHDRNWSGVAQHNDTRFALDLAADAKRLGDPPTVAIALLATDGVARLTGHDAIAAATERVALSVIAAGAVSQVIKISLGRTRPDETPENAANFAPFSGHDAFPSGHTTVAFSLASAIDAETRSRWVRAFVYPAAALTAWSRVRDGRHWPSDVVGATALATWTAWKVDHLAQRRLPRGVWVVVWPERDGAQVRVGGGF